MNRPKPEVMTADGQQGDGDRDAGARRCPPSSASSAPSPSAIAPMNPICIAQNRFSKPLPKKPTMAVDAEREQRAR